MQLEFAFIADYAAADRKLHAIGIGFDTLYAPSVPATHSMMCFVARISGSIAEVGTKDVSLRLIDADGENVVPPIEQRLPFDIKAPQLQANANVLVQMGGLVLPKYGEYAFHLTVQGNEMARVAFRVAQPPTTS